MRVADIHGPVSLFQGSDPFVILPDPVEFGLDVRGRPDEETLVSVPGNDDQVASLEDGDLADQVGPFLFRFQEADQTQDGAYPGFSGFAFRLALEPFSRWSGRSPSTTGTRAVWRFWRGNRKPSRSA